MKNKFIKRIPFLKNDFSRILLTETLPYEVPVFFSNDHFYERVKRRDIDNFDSEIRKVFFEFPKYTIPYNYEIIKDSSSKRVLSVMHPAIQLRYPNFYKRYHALIVSLCNRSNFSIRHPAKVASHLYEKKFKDESHAEIKDVEILGNGFDQQTSAASSFFSYSSFSMSHKFFDSHIFHELEKKYSYFRMLDISKCFHHIYTHSLCWAVKEKIYSKNNVDAKTFDNEFDKIMQHSNYNETNGILIGPETSRIFAELILQRIDSDTQKKIEEETLEGTVLLNKDYVIKRYVDDFYIFTNNIHLMEKIQKILGDALAEYKLYFNNEKTKDLIRPFSSSVTNGKVESTKIIDRLFDSLTEKTNLSKIYNPEFYENLIIKRNSSKSKNQNKNKESKLGIENKFEISTENGTTDDNDKDLSDEDKTILFPRYIKSPNATASIFIRDLKLSIFTNGSSFDNISSYFCSGLIKRLNVLLSRIDIENLTEFYSERLWRFLHQLLTFYFFIFSMSPRVKSTYQLSKFALIYLEIAKKLPRDYSENLKKTIFDEIYCVIISLKEKNDSFTIELCNLLALLGALGENYKLSENNILDIFKLKLNFSTNKFEKSKNDFQYFQIVSLLNYIGKDEKYSKLRQATLAHIKDIYLNSKGDTYEKFFLEAKNVLLALDILRCPYFESTEKTDLAKSIVEINHSTDQRRRAADLLKAVNVGDWFFRWDSILDLKTILQKKELRTAY